MGTSGSKKSDITIKSIRSSTEDIRSTLRRKKSIDQSHKADLHQILVDNSKNLDTLRAKGPKKKQIEIDQIQKFVSDVSEELLDYNDENLDKSADESHSFIHVDPRKIKMTKPSKQIKITSKNKETLRNLDEIHEKLTKVRNDVNVGLKNDDNNFLKLQKKKIEMLSTDLEMLLIPETSEINKIKQNLEKELYKLYQKILRKERKQTKLNESLKNHEEEKSVMNRDKLKSLDIMLEDVQDILQNFSRGDTRGNLGEIETELENIENQLQKIEDTDRENMKSKTKTARKLQEIRKRILKMRCEEESKKMEEITVKIDELTKNPQEAKMETLEELKKQLLEFPLEFQENKDFREEYLEDLKKKMDEFDPNHDGVILRPKLRKNASLENLLRIQEQFNSLENQIRVSRPEEAKKIDVLLEKFENSIRRKRKSIAEIFQHTDLIRTNVKLSELPTLQSLKTEKPIMKNETIPKINYGNVEKLLENLTKISDRVDEISKQIAEFRGNSEDLQYNFLISTLLEKKTTLENFSSHRTSWNQIDIFKHEILEKIQQNQRNLKNKLKQNILEKNLTNTREKINRFSGNFQNTLYKNIEQELEDIEKQNEELKIDKIQNDVNFLYKILREKSQVPSMVTEENLTGTLKVIRENDEIVGKLQERLRTSNYMNTDEASEIDHILLKKTKELINLNVKNDTPLFNDAQKILNTIETCRNLLKLKQTFMTFKNIESQLVQVQREISNFDGSITENYSKLDEKLNFLETSLNRIDCENNNNHDDNVDVYEEEKLKLSLRINYSKTQLYQVALDSEKIQNYEKRVREILETDQFAMENSDAIDEELIDLKINLEKMNVTETLSYRKITLLNYIEYLLKKISEKNNVQISKSVIV